MTFQRQLPVSGQQNPGGAGDYAGEAEYEPAANKAKKKCLVTSRVTVLWKEVSDVGQ
jgi:hypothetical protein